MRGDGIESKLSFQEQYLVSFSEYTFKRLLI